MRRSKHIQTVNKLASLLLVACRANQTEGWGMSVRAGFCARTFGCAIALAAIVSTVEPASAGFFTNATGLASPAETVDFTAFGLADNSVVTNQAASFGVTFSPFVYYNPQGGFFPNGRVGNFTFPTEPAFVNPVTLNLSGPITAAAFEMAADVTPYTFEALLGGSLVDSATVTAGATGQFFGFTGETFDAIEIMQAGAGGGPYWLVGNLQFGQSLIGPPVISTPEPFTLSLFGVGLAGAIAVRRRKAAKVA
jgi:hypothetical protein